MSKTQLKKELERMTSQQLVEVILDLYDARKDVKSWFDFFINPDSAKLEEKYEKAVNREFARTRRRMSRARISVIRKAIKEFESFSPDIDSMIKLYVHTVTTALSFEQQYEFSDTLIRGIDSIAEGLLDLADRNLILDRAIGELDRAVGALSLRRPYFRDHIGRVVQNRLEELSADRIGRRK